MENSGSTTHLETAAPDLARLFERSGPFATVYLATEGAVENAAQRVAARWGHVRDDLAAQGAAPAVLEAVEPLVAEAHRAGNCLAVIADAGGVAHVEHQPEPPRRDVGRWAPLPSIGPLLEWRQLAAPHVVVLADRVGADIVAVQRGTAGEPVEAGGGDYPIHKSGQGGWSQQRYEQRAENLWDKNAADVAAQVERVAEEVGARVIVAAGDVRALQLLREHLSGATADMLRTVDGSRSADGSLDEIAGEVVRQVATAVAEDTREVLEKYREETGQQDRAASGAAAVLEALRRSQVGLLLLHDDPDDDRTAWFGPEPGHAALTAEELRSLGVQDPVEGRLVDVVLRAALGTGAGVRIVPRAPLGDADGIGALLRWSA